MNLPRTMASKILQAIRNSANHQTIKKITMKGLEVTQMVANEVLFPFIDDAPCLNELIFKEFTPHNRDDIMIKVMEKEDDGKTINLLYS